MYNKCQLSNSFTNVQDSKTGNYQQDREKESPRKYEKHKYKRRNFPDNFRNDQKRKRNSPEKIYL